MPADFLHGQRVGVEFLGSAFLLATVIGSGIMGAKLSGGNEGLALLENTLPTGAMLFVLITMLSPISGAHLNPAVTGVLAEERNQVRSRVGLHLCAVGGRYRRCSGRALDV